MNPLYQSSYVPPKDDPSWMMGELARLHALACPNCDFNWGGPLFQLTTDLFAGRLNCTSRIDVGYHDFSHTCQVALCWARLMAGRTIAGAEPAIPEQTYRQGLAAVLFHDSGFLKDKADHSTGTGAKHAREHEKRSYTLAEHLLPDIGYTKADLECISHMIRATSLDNALNDLGFKTEAERICAAAASTADLMAQLGDPEYPEKLINLFDELHEADETNSVPMDHRIFPTLIHLQESTGEFWTNVVVPKLVNDCGQLYRYLAWPYPNGENPYLSRTLKNLSMVEHKPA